MAGQRTYLTRYLQVGRHFKDTRTLGHLHLSSSRTSANMSGWMDVVLTRTTPTSNHDINAANPFCQLPPELHSSIFTHLRTIDVKQVRLTCRLF